MLRRLSLVVLLAGGLPTRAATQTFERPWLDWRTLETPHFTLHYPSAFEAWARFVGERIDGVDSAVSRTVGYNPTARVHVVVEDPYAIPNGFALPFVHHPMMVLWATPPGPRDDIGSFRSWGDLLAVHELAHIAHLSRPSRNPITRTFWGLLPADLGPIPLRAPRWVVEGYATYVEGLVSGTGRPHGVWRPAMLRQWAIEGRLPTYAQLSNWGDFAGSEFAYLAGSAYLEWLARRQGDSSLVHVWRRLTARQNRSFGEAFTGVFGDPPQDLYSRFTAELTASAMEVERRLDAAGRIDGEMVQHLAWNTGDPSISADGKRVAIVLRSNARPSRVVIWTTASEPDTAQARARERLLRRDPEDVPPRRFYPPPKRAQATLIAKGGRGFDNPRWMPDGQRLLLSRLTPRPDGSYRPELYLWNTRGGGVRRITHGAGIRDADPAPDGRNAVAVQCAGGYCDLVGVDLASGVAHTLAAGDMYTSYARPRFAPNGYTIAVAVHADARWRIALLDSTAKPPRFVDPDDGASRYDPAWLSPTTLVVASERGGIVNLERLDLDGTRNVGAVRTLTRVTGAAVAPAPNPADGSIWFLSLHSHGYDVRRLPPEPQALAARPLADTSITLDPRLIPSIAAPPRDIRTFAAFALPTPRPYGSGPRSTRWFPLGVAGADGHAGGLALYNVDLVGRLSLLAQGLVGNDGAWRGGALDAAWRGMRPRARLSVFLARQTPRWSGRDLLPADVYDVELRGAMARVDYDHAFDMAQLRSAVGASLAALEPVDVAQRGIGRRHLVFAELGLAARQTGDGPWVAESMSLHGATGSTGHPAVAFTRAVLAAGLRVGGQGVLPLDLGASLGRVSSGAHPFEQFVVGGIPATLLDRSLMTQRLTMPALPAGVAIGDRAIAFRAAMPVGAFTPYYWGASARVGDGRFARWHRVAGVEATLETSQVPVAGIPDARIVAGVGRSLDAPLARRFEGYLAITLQP